MATLCTNRYGKQYAVHLLRCHATTRPRRICVTPLTAYEILGVPPSASKAEIKAAFRCKAMHYHPDVAGEGIQHSKAMFQEVHAAYSQLLGHPNGTALDPEKDFQDGWCSDGQNSAQKDVEDPNWMFGAFALCVPLAFVLPEFLNGHGVLNCMLTEHAILKNGGWACHGCTCVNESSAKRCKACQQARPMQDSPIQELRQEVRK